MHVARRRHHRGRDVPPAGIVLPLGALQANAMVSPRSLRSARRIAAALCTALAIESPGLADQVTLSPLKDNTIFSESNSTSNGAGTGIFAGKTSTGAIRRALLAFNVAGAIPAGSTITSVQLVLTVTMSIAGEER